MIQPKRFSGENAVVIRDLVKAYKKTNALDSLTLHIPRGSVFGLVGANGAGKTSLMSICSGLTRPTSGEVDLLGEGGFNVDVHSGRITVMPQDCGLPNYTRVGEILKYYAQLQGLSRRESIAMSDEALQWVNLYDRRRDMIRSLSHGMLGRLIVAQAFLGDPEIVFLDEPMSGLDPKEVQNLRRLIRSKAGEQTIVVSSHLLYEMENLCDEVAFIEKGRLLKQDKMANLLNRRPVIRVILDPETPPPSETTYPVTGLEDVSRSWQPETNELTITWKDEREIPEVNAALLPWLLGAGCRILSVERGSDLEQVFLDSSAEQ